MEESIDDDREVTLAPPPDDDDDDVPVLSSHALDALKEFFSQQNLTLTLTDDDNGRGAEEDDDEVSLVTENWRLSQFWYDPETAETVAKEVLTLCESLDCPSVACVACPTLYAYLKKINGNVSAQLLEYDMRFQQYGREFTYYDYNEPEELPSSMMHAYQIIVADPPYLSKECLEKVSKTVSFLKQSEEKCYLLLLTGAVQTERASELLGLRPCVFQPQHANKLGNEFRLFTNYDPGMRLGGWHHQET